MGRVDKVHHNFTNNRSIINMEKLEMDALLWVDDDIAEMGPYLDALRDAGFDVATACSHDEAIAAASVGSFKVVLVDILMPPPDGIEVLRRMHELLPTAALGALSSYLYLDRYRAQLRDLDFPVELIDKDMPNVMAEEFHIRFIEPIRQLAERGVQTTIAEQERRVAEIGDIDPFSIPLHEFLQKSILEKDHLAQEARKIVAAPLKRAFQDGYIWVVFCGSSQQPRGAAKTPEEVMPEERIMEFARNAQRAPFQFFRPIDVDDMWSDCGPSTYARDYPTLSFELGADLVHAHFDTGAPITFFSYESLVQRGVIKPTGFFSPASRGDVEYWCVPLDIEVMLQCQKGGPKRMVHLRGQAVRDWLEAPYARFCREDCDQFRTHEKRLCKHRIALVGRNILTENKLTVVLDGALRKTGLGKP